MKYLTRFADKNTALEFTTGGRVLKAPHVSKVGNDAVFSENIERGKSCIFVEENDGELKIVKLVEAFVTFTAQQNNSTIGLNKLSSYQTLEYKTASSDWISMSTSTNIRLNNIGDKVYVRGVLSSDNTYEDYTQFSMTGKIAASGNCNSLWNYQDLNAPLKQYCGNSMFYGCTSLTQAPELPATALAEFCYYRLFDGCTSLTTAPELPATTLAKSCYRFMFDGCTSLTTAPSILPATTLVYSCYYGMFEGCTSLTKAPELPATTLAVQCYYSMFRDCDSLTTAPELPATKLVESCYDGMFSASNNLNYIKCLATDISARDCTINWVYNVSPTGTFVKHPDMNKWYTDTYGIPKGWTVVDAEL